MSTLTSWKDGSLGVHHSHMQVVKDGSVGAYRHMTASGAGPNMSAIMDGSLGSNCGCGSADGMSAGPKLLGLGAAGLIAYFLLKK